MDPRGARRVRIHTTHQAARLVPQPPGQPFGERDTDAAGHPAACSRKPVLRCRQARPSWRFWIIRSAASRPSLPRQRENNGCNDSQRVVPSSTLDTWYDGPLTRRKTKRQCSTRANRLPPIIRRSKESRMHLPGTGTEAPPAADTAVPPPRMSTLLQRFRQPRWHPGTWLPSLKAARILWRDYGHFQSVIAGAARSIEQATLCRGTHTRQLNFSHNWISSDEVRLRIRLRHRPPCSGRAMAKRVVSVEDEERWFQTLVGKASAECDGDPRTGSRHVIPT